MINLVVLLLLLWTVLWLMDLYFYALRMPQPNDPPIKHGFASRTAGLFLHRFAYVLSLLRSPFQVVTYFVQALYGRVTGTPYRVYENTYRRELLSIGGDFANLLLGAVVVYVIAKRSGSIWVVSILYAVLAAEIFRLAFMRGQMIFSAGWQQLPHRKVALAVRTRSRSMFGSVPASLRRYCDYYALSDERRCAYILSVLRDRTSRVPSMSERLAYFSGFCIVPDTHLLKGGWVRDIPTGRVFTHRSWTNDPWLLLGLACRRAPWIFDPRYLRRPFHFRSEASGLCEKFVLEHSRNHLPFALYQFGARIMYANYEPWYKGLRLLGYDREPFVYSDGTQIARIPIEDNLWSDEKVISDVASGRQCMAILTPMDVAERYQYPIKYVEEVLYPKMHNAMMTARRD